MTEAEKALIAGDAETLERLLHEPRPEEAVDPATGLGPDFSGDDVHAIIARNHQVDDWDQFQAHVNGAFEQAVDAAVSGEAETLRGLLREHPELVQQRSARRHHAKLLHYCGANGFEYFRQKTPANAVEIAALLLDAGTEVDSVAEIYGGSTTLGLVATSIFPLRAGVQEALMTLLLDRGAAIDGGMVNACLANGRGQAAEYLAGRGAQLDLEGAAGVAKLDLVERLFEETGPAKIQSGFHWACEYGRSAVVEFLLRKSTPIGNGLHWAALGGHAGIVKRLLQHGSPVDLKDERWGSTPLGWALHGWGEAPVEGHYEGVELLIGAGAKIDAKRLEIRDGRMAALLKNAEWQG